MQFSVLLNNLVVQEGKITTIKVNEPFKHFESNLAGTKSKSCGSLK